MGHHHTILTTLTHSPISRSTGASDHSHSATSVLAKYAAMLKHHTTQVLSMAAKVGAISSSHFHLASTALMGGASGALLPELAVGLVLLQFQAPLLLADSDCVSLISSLVQPLDKFNQTAPGAIKEDQEDLAWPGVKSECCLLLYTVCSSVAAVVNVFVFTFSGHHWREGVHQ